MPCLKFVGQKFKFSMKVFGLIFPPFKTLFLVRDAYTLTGPMLKKIVCTA